MVPSRFPRLMGALLSLFSVIAVGRAAAAENQSDTRPLITRPVDESSLVVLQGNVHPLAQPRFDRGPAPVSLSATRMMLVLKRTSLQQQRLEQYLSSLEDKNSPNFHRFLTPEQFGQQYGPASEDVAQIVSWLNSQGFSVTNVPKSRMEIEFSGSVDQVQSAFHAQIHRFVVNGREHVANISNPMIPSALAPVVAGVSPLNDFFPRPQVAHGPSARWDAMEKRFVPELTVGISGSTYLFVGPGDVSTIYDAPNTLNTQRKAGQATYDGSGVTIGIATDGGVNLSNVRNYRALFQLPPATISVVMDGNSPGSGDDTESTMDGEIAGSIAPGASLVYYQAADSTFQSGVMLAILRALDDNTVNILNVSYGSCELAQGAAGNQEILNAWQQAAAQGIAVTVSAGDSGSAGCDNPDTQTTASQGFGVNGLASTAYTVSVGGTDFDALANKFSTYVAATNGSNYTSALGYIPENTWNDSTTANATAAGDQAAQDNGGATNIIAGGGGASSAGLYGADGSVLGGYAKPAWQHELEMGDGMTPDAVRDLPDVSLFAANGMHGALWATCGDNDCSGSAPTISGIGGTSASAPAFAGVLALINQKLGASQRLGQPNWVLYALARTHPEIYHQVKSGNNAVVCAVGTPNCGANGFLSGYNATGSYNLTTGLGSVDIAALVNDWTSVGRTQTGTTLTLSSASFQHGQPVTIGIGVNPSAATGNVAITDDLSARGLFGSDSQLNLPLSNGQATGSWEGLPGGTYNVYAIYGGDANYGTSVSEPTQITVTPEDSVLQLSVTAADSNGQLVNLAGRTVTYGTYLSVDAQPVGKSQIGAANPLHNATGTVTFADTNPNGAQGSGMLDATGNAEFPLHALSAGTHTVSASYWGDNSYNASNSGSVSFTVTKAGTTVSVTSSPVAGNSFLNVTATIRPNVAVSAVQLPNGTVTFTNATSGDVLGTVGGLNSIFDPSTGTYEASVTTEVMFSQLRLGNNNIVATYNGDTNYTSSAASAPALVACSSGCGNAAGQTLEVGLESITPTNASGPAGTTWTVPVNIGSVGGFTGSVKLSCAVTGTQSWDVNIPTCSFNTATVTITTSASVGATLTVATTAPAARTASASGHAWITMRGGVMAACVLLFGLPGRRRSMAVLRTLICVAVLGAGLSGLTACSTAGNAANSSSGAATSPATQGTTPDAYTITVRAVDVATGTLTAQNYRILTVM